MLRGNRHDSAHILGAICPARGAGAAIIAPAANTEYINAHLAALSTQAGPGATAVVAWNGAGRRWTAPGGPPFEAAR